jgi:hypothetical protein
MNPTTVYNIWWLMRLICLPFLLGYLIGEYLLLALFRAAIKVSCDEVIMHGLDIEDWGI